MTSNAARHRCHERGPTADANGGGAFDGLVELIDEPLGEGRHERVLVTDVAVHDRLAHAGRRRDVVHRHLGSVGSDDAHRGLEELLAVRNRVAGAGPTGSTPGRDRGGAGRHVMKVPSRTCDRQTVRNFSVLRVSSAGESGCYVRHMSNDESCLVIIDAQNFSAPPVATVHLLRRVLYGAHGSWVPDGTLN